MKFSGGLSNCNLDAKPDSIWDILQERSTLFGDKTFLNFIDLQQTLTYRETADRAGAIGLGLREYGIQIGAQVGLLLSSSPLHVLAWFSTIGSAMVDVPINPDFRGDVLDHAIEKIEVSAIFADEAGLEALQTASASARARLELVVVTDAVYDWANAQLMAPKDI